MNITCSNRSNGPIWRWGLLGLWIASSVIGREVLADEPTAPKFDAAALEFFEKEVRPILVSRCYECHSRESKKVQGNLWLDSRAAALKGGDTGPALVPGKPKESLLIDAINYGETYQMPPKSRMPAAEIAVLTRWVEMGAPWPEGKAAAANTSSNMLDLPSRRAEHWCWKPVELPALPVVKMTQWPQQELDRFVLAKLEAAGLKPTTAAERRALLRRVSLDLTGLPPSRAEVEAFVRDESPGAFEKKVDELLRSPQFGERWARHWLDLVRYAETYGHEFDYPIPHAAAYRDYVIRAFNADVPYDQFVMEHLAGDLLTKPRLHPTEGYNESIIGTGFWFLGEATHAPVDVRGDEQGRIDNQLDVMSKTFLGVTIACARCHDHKFDAISTKDYYALAGFLKSSRRQEAMLDPHGRIADTARQLRELTERGDKVVRQAVPRATAETGATVARYLLGARQVQREGLDRADAVAQARQLDSATLRRWVAALTGPEANQPTHAFQPWVALSGLAGEPQAAEIAAQRERVAGPVKRASEQREAAPVFAHFDSGDYATAGWFVTGEAFGATPTRTAQWDAASRQLQAVRPGVAHSGLISDKAQGVLRSPTFTISHRNILYRLKGRDVQIRLIIDGYFMDTYNGLLFGGCNHRVDRQDDWGWRVQGGDVGRYLGHRAHIEIIDQGDGFVALDEIRFSDHGPPADNANLLGLKVLSDDSPASLDVVAANYGRLVAVALDHWQAGACEPAEVELVNWMLNQGLLSDEAAVRTQREALAPLAKELDRVAPTIPAPPRVLAMADGTALNDRVHIRGNHRTLGDSVPRRLLEALDGQVIGEAERGSGRLLLARQVVDPKNPLTARVFVNRVWHHLFGRGIVPSVDNFGVLGQPPSHPELLDHLAARFVQEGWSIKQLMRMIVLSSTYQMSSAPEASAEAVDPQNRLLHRQNIRRLEGEAMRDALLKISGRLDPALYGPSVPVHLTPFMQGRGRPGGSGPLDGNGRRSIYTEVRRNFLPPMMLAFDTPIPFSTVGARNTSNVPAQALILMNDPLVVQQAQVWAKRALEQTSVTDAQRIESLYVDAFSRGPSPDEAAAALSFLDQQAQEYRLATDQARRDLRVWSDLCHVLLNVKEFVFVH